MPAVENLLKLPANKAAVTLFQHTNQGKPEEFAGQNFVPLSFPARGLDWKNNPKTAQEWDQLVRSEFGQLWHQCFGEEGYLVRSTREAEEIVADQNLLEKAFALSRYGHQEQKRGTGGPYVRHPVAVATWLAENYKPPAWILAAILCHDLEEDTQKMVKREIKGKMREVQYPYRVDLADIGHHLGKRVEKFVDALTKVRKMQKETDTVQTRNKLIRAFGQHPSVIPSKVGDRLHNISTIEGKPSEDQVNIAADTFETIIIFAHLFGLHKEADWLADECYEILDKDLHRDDPGFAQRIRSGIEQYLEPLNMTEMEDYTRRRLTKGIGLRHLRIRRPGVFAITESLRGRRQLKQNDFFLSVDLVLNDEMSSDVHLSEDGDQKGFEARALNAVSHFILSKKYRYSEGKNSGTEEAQKTIDEGQTFDELFFNVDYEQGEKRVPVRLRVIKKSAYDLETTPLTYLDAVELSKDDRESLEGYQLEERQALAQKKFALLQEQFHALAHSQPPEELVRRFFLIMPDNIVVLGGKEGKGWRQLIEYKRSPVRRGATVLDYAVDHLPNSWWTIKEVYLDGELQPDVSRALSRKMTPGMKIHFKFGKRQENFIEVSWFDAVGVMTPESLGKMAVKMQEKINNLQGDGKLIEVELIRKEMITRGTEIIRNLFFSLWDNHLKAENKNSDNPAFAFREIPLSYIDKVLAGRYVSFDDFIYEVGMYAVDEKLMLGVLKSMLEVRKNLIFIDLPIEEREGAIADTLQIFAKNGINLIEGGGWTDIRVKGHVRLFFYEGLLSGNTQREKRLSLLKIIKETKTVRPRLEDGGFSLDIAMYWLGAPSLSLDELDL